MKCELRNGFGVPEKWKNGEIIAFDIPGGYVGEKIKGLLVVDAQAPYTYMFFQNRYPYIIATYQPPTGDLLIYGEKIEISESLAESIEFKLRDELKVEVTPGVFRSIGVDINYDSLGREEYDLPEISDLKHRALNIETGRYVEKTISHIGVEWKKNGGSLWMESEYIEPEKHDSTGNDSMICAIKLAGALNVKFKHMKVEIKSAKVMRIVTTFNKTHEILTEYMTCKQFLERYCGNIKGPRKYTIDRYIQDLTGGKN